TPVREAAVCRASCRVGVPMKPARGAGVMSSGLTVTIGDSTVELVQEATYRWRLPRHGAMRVDGVVFASPALLPGKDDDQTLAQVANVATLPGIVGASYAMPDMHWGYGFPIGGVAGTDVAAGGVVSPAGVGF